MGQHCALIIGDDLKPEKKLFIKTYGCQMNVYDSQRMADVLAPLGFSPTDEIAEADMVILNTCHIREKAEEKVYSDLGRIKKHKQARANQGKQTIISVAGCVAQAEGEEILRRAPIVDLVFGPQTYHRLPEMMANLERKSTRLVDTEFPTEDKFDFLTKPESKIMLKRGVSAFVTVQEGCDKFCTFCVVPYTRGTEQSRPVSMIIEEVRNLAEAGVREVTLLGQNVNAYHGAASDGDTWSLARLLGELAEIPGMDRLRYTTSHPRDMNDDLINAHRDNPAVMPYLHLPVQSGSDRILAAMNRKHTHKSYLELIDKIRGRRPDIALSGDFIVGFPGETDQDFNDTMRLVEQVGYAQTYSFKYSPRPGTPAADLGGQVEEHVKSERLTALQALLNKQQLAFNTTHLGAHLPVLLERKGRKPGQLVGKSPYLQAVHTDAPDHMIGQIAKVKIDQVNTNSLSGQLVLDDAGLVKPSGLGAIAQSDAQLEYPV